MKLLFAIFAWLVLVQPVHAVSTTGIYTTINHWREVNKLPTYRPSLVSCQIAFARLPEVQVSFSHAGFYSKTIYCYQARRGCYIGENLARNFKTEGAMLDAWLNSPKHKENLVSILYPYSCIATDGNTVVHAFSSI